MSELETRVASLRAMTSEELWKYLDEVNLLDDTLKRTLNVVRTETMALQRMRMNLRGEVPAGMPYARLVPDLTTVFLDPLVERNSPDLFNPTFDVTGLTADEARDELHAALTGETGEERLEQIAAGLTPRQAARLAPTDPNDPWARLRMSGRMAEARAMRLITAAVADGRLPMRETTVSPDAAVMNMLVHLRDEAPMDLLTGLEEQDVVAGATMALLGNVATLKAFREAIASQLEREGTELIDDLGDEADPERTYVAITVTDEKAHARVVDRELVAGLLWAVIHLDTNFRAAVRGGKREVGFREMLTEAGFGDVQRVVIGEGERSVHVLVNGAMVLAEDDPTAAKDADDDGASAMSQFFKTIREAMSTGKIGRVVGADGRDVDLDKTKKRAEIKEACFPKAPLDDPGNEDLLRAIGTSTETTRPATAREEIVTLRKGWRKITKATGEELLTAIDDDQLSELVGLHRLDPEDVETHADGSRWFNGGRLAKDAVVDGREYIFTGEGWEIPTPMTTTEAEDHVRRMVVGEDEDDISVLDDRSFRLEVDSPLILALFEKLAPAAAAILRGDEP